MKKRSILFYNNWLAAGGVEVFLATLIPYLVEKGYDVTVSAVPKTKKDFHHPFGPRVKSIWRMGMKERFRKGSLLWFFHHALYRVCEGIITAYCSLRHYDIIVATQEKWLTKNTARIKGGRKFTWIHTDYSTRLNLFDSSFANAEEELACLRGFEKVVCVSETARQGFLQTIGDPGNLCVRYNPIDADGIRAEAALPCPLAKPQGQPLLLFMGRLDPEKQTPLMLEACALLHREMSLQLWIIGEGSDGPALKAAIAEGKMDWVRLLGWQSNPYTYLAQADILISASLTEGYGLSIQEALIVGVPVAAIRCPIMAETLDPRFGAISENSAEALAETLRGMLQTPGVLETYREQIARHYSTDALYTERLEAICGLWENGPEG